MTEVVVQGQATAACSVAILADVPVPQGTGRSRPSRWKADSSRASPSTPPPRSASPSLHERRSGQLGDGDPVETGLQGMDDRKLLARRRLHQFADPHDVATLVGSEPQTEGPRIRDDVEHAAIRHVHGDRAEGLHFQVGVDMRGEGGDVQEGHIDHLSIPALRVDLDETRGRLEGEVREGFPHLQYSGFERHRDHADRVGARHARVLDLLHDHEAEVGLGIRGGKDHVAVGGGKAARLAQHAQAEAVAVLGQVPHLREHRRPRDVEHATDDDPARLAGRVGVDRLDHAREPHPTSSSLIRQAYRTGPPSPWCARPRAARCGSRLFNPFEQPAPEPRRYGRDFDKCRLAGRCAARMFDATD